MEALLLTLAASPWVYPALWLFATIDGFFPPIPSETAVIALAALGGASGAPSVPLVILAAALGAFTGDQVAYTIGALVDVRRLPYLHRPRPQAMLGWAERALSERGASFILAARYIPVGRVAVNMTAGALRFPRRRFSSASAPSGCGRLSVSPPTSGRSCAAKLRRPTPARPIRQIARGGGCSAALRSSATCRPRASRAAWRRSCAPERRRRGARRGRKCHSAAPATTMIAAA